MPLVVQGGGMSEVVAPPQQLPGLPFDHPPNYEQVYVCHDVLWFHWYWVRKPDVESFEGFDRQMVAALATSGDDSDNRVHSGKTPTYTYCTQLQKNQYPAHQMLGFESIVNNLYRGTTFIFRDLVNYAKNYDYFFMSHDGL